MMTFLTPMERARKRRRWCSLFLGMSEVFLATFFREALRWRRPSYRLHLNMKIETIRSRMCSEHTLTWQTGLMV